MRVIFERQWLHALLLAPMVLLLAWAVGLEGVRAGRLWGVSTTVWYWTAAALPVAHQLWVWFCWRPQLHLSLMTRVLGSRGFLVYAVAFAVLGISRVLALLLLAASNRGTFDIAPTVGKTLALILAVPAAYLFYSVKRYFGFRRAMGLDHFDESYRTLPLVRQGIFRFTSNGMYVFGFFVQWIPALWYGSTAALCIALFNHLYIWVHYYSTELPDMRRIYGTLSAESRSGD